MLLLGFGAATFVTRTRQAAPARAAIAPKPRLAQPPARPFLMFVSLVPDDTFKHVVIAPLNAPDAARFLTPLQCDRVYYAGTRGLCLTAADHPSGAASYVARVFDEQFAPLHTVALSGAPSRTRLSPDGRRAAFTVFDEGHSYADGVFSTRTTIIDTAAGTVIGDLESWTITRDGTAFKDRDFNFWGVTFAPDGNTFYATLRTKGSAYLIEGDVDARTARVLMQGAECPSLSPDRARIAFKKRLGGSGGWWQLSLYDVASHAVRPLRGDSQSVDDQVEWLDASNLLYFRPNDDGNFIWRLPTDTGEAPQPFVREGFSPAVVR
ncbi:MAG: translocation protein TolB [Acidobacteria bacterium]|nr:translocation protein TolB [Acidobacteriota bacterium]